MNLLVTRQKVMLDLFCGRGGWTKGFLAHGWRCIGIDLFPQPDYPGEFIQADIAHLLELPEADFYCCSSPCEQFSIHGMKHFHPNPKWPWLGIALFNRAKELLEATGKPYVMENVRAANKFIGKQDYAFGPFYIWGNCLGKMWPWPAYDLTRLKKGLYIGSGNQVRTLPREKVREYRKQFAILQTGSKSKERAEITAELAEIPFPLSSHIAHMAGLM